ncbi:hypothetical protein CAPTEDRAFT_204551, partial [Capitella teleta]
MTRLALLFLWLTSSCNGQVFYTNISRSLLEVPSDIPSNVTNIDLCYNQFTFFGPREFSNFTSLTTFNASYNPLEFIDYSAFEDTMIDQLLIMNTKLTTIPDLNLPTLAILKLQNNPGVTEVDFVHLTSQYSVLRSIRLDHCSINHTTWPQNATDIKISSVFMTKNDLDMLDSGAMSSWHKLQWLVLNENALSTFGCEFINDTLLDVLMLSYNHLNTMPDLQCVGQTLIRLDLRRNMISAVAIEDFQYFKALVTLDLRDNLISSLGEWTEVKTQLMSSEETVCHKAPFPINTTTWISIQLRDFCAEVSESFHEGAYWLSKLVHKRLYDYLLVKKFLYPISLASNQTETQPKHMVSVVDRISRAFKQGKVTISVLLDFQKTFDTVQHKILLSKLLRYRIRGTPHNDTTLYCSGPNIEHSMANMNSDLQNAFNYFAANSLQANASKTNYMIIHPNRNTAGHTPLHINNTNISQVKESTFLGITIDHKLTFQPHIKRITNRISSGLFALRQ